MQKFVASILLLLYSAANLGLTARFDYCGERINGVALFATELAQPADCCGSKMMEGEDCCSSSIAVFQESSDKMGKSQERIFHPSSPVHTFQYPILVKASFLSLQSGPIRVQAVSPPGPRVHLRNACFLI